MDPKGKWSFNLPRGLDETKRGETEERGFFYKRPYDRQTEGRWSYDDRQGLFPYQGRETNNKKSCYPTKDKWSAGYQTEDKWSNPLEDLQRKHAKEKREFEDMFSFYKRYKQTKGNKNWSYGCYQTEDKCSYNLPSVRSVLAEKRREIEDILFFYKQTEGKWSYDQSHAHQMHLHEKRGETEEWGSFFVENPVIDRLMHLIEQESVETIRERERGFFLKCHDGDKLWLRYSPSLHPNSEQDNWLLYPNNPFYLNEPYDPHHVWTIDQRVPKLYIWLGLDNIFCLHLNQLLSCTTNPKLKMVFSLCNKHNIGTEYPPGGLFVMDSKLHYLGGNFNKKVSSFNLPSFKPDHSTFLPDHSHSKARPIVFTISNKVYALETVPLSMDHSQSDLFEVFEPEIGEWRSLPAPPVPALCTLRSHFIFRNKLLLQTFYGDFIFDTNEEMKKWEKITTYPKCFALLEYKEDLLLVLTREPFKLVAYELTPFGEIDCTSPHVLRIKKRYFEFSKLSIVWASLNLVEDNCICLVFISMHYIHVLSFQVMKTDDKICANVKAYHEIDIPIERSPDFLLYSTFIWSPPDVNQQQNPADTKLISNI